MNYHYLCPIIGKFANRQIKNDAFIFPLRTAQYKEYYVLLKYLFKNEKNLFFISLVRVSC